nr:MAG TPA: hypothetical protein [Caudoviricetes sp.]
MLAQNSPSLQTTPNKTEKSKQTRTTPNNLEIFQSLCHTSKTSSK